MSGSVGATREGGHEGGREGSWQAASSSRLPAEQLEQRRTERGRAGGRRTETNQKGRLHLNYQSGLWVKAINQPAVEPSEVTRKCISASALIIGDNMAECNVSIDKKNLPGVKEGNVYMVSVGWFWRQLASFWSV